MQSDQQLLTHFEIQEAVLDGIRTANSLFLKQQPVSPQMNTVLLGAEGALDSLALVNLLVLLEDAISQAIGKPVPLLDNTLLLDGSGANVTVADVCALASRLADRR